MNGRLKPKPSQPARIKFEFYILDALNLLCIGMQWIHHEIEFLGYQHRGNAQKAGFRIPEEFLTQCLGLLEITRSIELDSSDILVIHVSLEATEDEIGRQGFG